jgi:FtsP/CotA-like multicopper oxidase with cupredoxin domain
MDGAVGFTQCPIPSGSSYTYNFTIGDDETGTYWWHSHSDVQRADGLWGGLIVHSPEVEKVPMDEILLMVGDWFHRNQTDVLGWYTDASSMGNEPVPDSLLINGYGRFNCDMAVPARPVNCSQIAVGELRPLLRRPSGASLRLRVVNTGTVAGFTISIDNAVLTPVRVDGGFEVQSEATSAVGILYPGERVDLDVKWAEEQPGSSWFTVHLDDE